VRIACIVPHYGTELTGTTERHGRLIAEQLAERHAVDVLATCARDEHTWRNEYAEGADRVRGVTVRRFATSRTRDDSECARYAEWLLTHRHGRTEEVEWLKREGPWSPGLVEYLERHHQQFDVLLFFGYGHAPVASGIRVAPHKSVLVPLVARRDDPALQLGVVQEVFGAAAGIAWSSDAEREFIRGRFPLRAVAEAVIGCGVALPEGEAVAEGAEPPAPPEGGREPFAPHIEGPANAFRRRHRIYQPFVLHAGRIDAGRGVEELLEYFQSYVKDGGDATLVLMGVKCLPIPDDPHVRFAGVLPDEERLHALEAASVVVAPFPDDGPALVALEAFSVGTPVLGNARSDALVDACRRSQAGLFYADRWEFVEGLKLLLRDEALRAAMGRHGKAFINQHHRWSLVLQKYEQLFGRLRGGAAGSHQADRGRDAQAPRERTADAGPEPGRDRDRQRDWNRSRGRRPHRDRDRGRRPQHRRRP